jgi:Tol biopolymer transport system component
MDIRRVKAEVGADGRNLCWEQIYVQDGAELRLRLASSPRSPILDPQLSPDGCSIAYVRDDELFILPISNGEPKQITFGARETGKVRCSPIWGWNITTHF